MYFKSFKQIFQELGDHMREDGALATDKRPGALLGALMTAVAASLSMGWLGLAEIYSMFFVSLSTGTHLRRRVLDLGMVPNPGDFARGRVMLVPVDPASIGSVITAGTLLVGPGDLLFEVQADVPVGTPFTTALVACTTVGTSGNLSAGTLLAPFNVVNTQVTFKVGSAVDSLGLALGDLEGGLEPETDDEIKKRFPAYLIGLSRCTLGAVRQALQETAGVFNLVLQNNSPGPGWVTVLVTTADDTLSQALRDAVASTMEGFSAAGIGYRLKIVQKRQVNVGCSVVATDSSLGPSVIRARVTTAIRAVTQDLTAGRSIYKEELIKAGFTDDLVRFQLLYPGDTLAGAGEILVIGNVDVAVSYED